MTGVSDILGPAITHPRIVDMESAMLQGAEPLAYRVRPIAVDGQVTMIAGRRGESKSWLGLVACAAVQAELGDPFSARAGRAIYLDAEMGARMMGRRFVTLGLAPDSFIVADGMGLRLPDDIGVVKDIVQAVGANLIVLDSLRRLTPGKRENDSDDMAPVMAVLGELSRDTECAVLLIHHRSTSINAKDSRGSSAIEDQVDNVFVLEKASGDPESRTRRRLRCVKMRDDAEPASVWLDFKMAAGLMTMGEAEPYDSGDGEAHVPMFEVVAQEIRDLGGMTPDDGWQPGELAEAADRRRDDKNFKAALKQLLDAGEWKDNSGNGRARRVYPANRGNGVNTLRAGSITPVLIPGLAGSESPVNTRDSHSGDPEGASIRPERDYPGSDSSPAMSLAEHALRKWSGR
ncbi:MAG: AAA family ATPase [Solirubrobacteraceae bacterium]